MTTECEFVFRPIVSEWKKGDRYYVRLSCGHARRTIYRSASRIAELKEYGYYHEICQRCTEAEGGTNS